MTYLRRLGFAVDSVERWLPRVNKRRDCFGWADLLVCHRRHRIVALVQVTTADHLAARISKAKQRPELLAWVQSGGAAWFHGWHQRNGRWDVRIVEVKGDDLKAVVLQGPRHRRQRRGDRQGDLFSRQPA